MAALFFVNDDDMHGLMCCVLRRCIPYRNKYGSDDEVEVLLVSSQKSTKMMFPKVCCF